jgi:hypothetical protein
VWFSYLADGTMIVVENGDKLIGQDVVTEVTRVFQTVAGKMIFAVPRNTPVADRPVDTLTPDEPAVKPAPPTPKAASTAGEPSDAKADHSGGNRNNKRFDRNRRHGNGNGPNGGNSGNGSNTPSPATTSTVATAPSVPAARPPRRDDIEGRIIAATNKPRPEKPANPTA